MTDKDEALKLPTLAELFTFGGALDGEPEQKRMRYEFLRRRALKFAEAVCLEIPDDLNTQTVVATIRAALILAINMVKEDDTPRVPIPAAEAPEMVPTGSADLMEATDPGDAPTVDDVMSRFAQENMG